MLVISQLLSNFIYKIATNKYTKEQYYCNVMCFIIYIIRPLFANTP